MLTLLSRRAIAVALTLALGFCGTPSRADETNERWIAAVPFGAGQFHRGDFRLGAFFGVGEAVLGATALATWADVERLSSIDVTRPGDNGRNVDVPALNRMLQALTVANNIAFASWTTLMVSGVIEAQVNISLRRSEPRNPLNPSPRVSIGALPGGASLGLHLTF